MGLDINDEPLLDAIASSSIPRLPEFNSQALSNTAWSLAVICSRDNRPLMEALSAESSTRGLQNVLGTKHSYAVLWTTWTMGKAEHCLHEILQSEYEDHYVPLSSEEKK